MVAPRAVVLDYGGVLSLPPSEHDIRALVRFFGVQRAKLESAYNQRRHLYDLAELSPREFWSGIASSVGRRLSRDGLVRLRKIDRAMWGRVRAPLLTWAQELRTAGYRTAVLSNMPADGADYIRANFGWLRRFDSVILSAEVGLAKPDPRIFRQCLDRLSVSATQVLFIDDRRQNVSAARSLKVPAIEFRSVARLREELELIGFRPLPFCRTQRRERNSRPN